MAKRRMFSQEVISSDNFLDMPGDAQRLYFFLVMYADDDGFVASPKSIMRMCNVSEDNYKILIMKRFVIPFESGVMVIRHWKLNNYIQKDRYTETLYKEEKARLTVIDGTYMLIDVEVDRNRIEETVLDTICIQNVYTGKDRLEQDRIEKTSSSVVSPFEIPTIEQVRAYAEEHGCKADPEEFIAYYENCNWKYERSGRPVNWKVALIQFKAKPEQPKYTQEIKEIFNAYQEICKSLKSVMKLTDRRKKAIRAKLNQGFTVEDFRKAFTLAEASPFMRGERPNQNYHFHGYFDWFFDGDNLVKTLEKKYNDDEPPKPEEDSGTDNDIFARL